MVSECLNASLVLSLKDMAKKRKRQFTELFSGNNSSSILYHFDWFGRRPMSHPRWPRHFLGTLETETGFIEKIEHLNICD